MKWQEIDVAIDQHAIAVSRFKEAQKVGRQNLGELIEVEFATRRVLVDGKSDETSVEVRRMTYLMGFLIGSRVLQYERLSKLHFGVRQ